MSPGALRLDIPITPELGAAAAGELLLSYLNDKERWGYSTHEFVRGNFREIEALPPLDIRTICCGCWANTPGEGDTVNWWRSDELGLDVFRTQVSDYLTADCDEQVLS